MKQNYKKLIGMGLIGLLVLFFQEDLWFQFQKPFYEKISGISLPWDSKIIETHDNGEWCTITAIRMAKSDLEAMIQTNSFVTREEMPGSLCGVGMLRFVQPNDQTMDRQFVFQREVQTTNATYWIDLNQGILFASISYPD
jgi:hypothetical protein